MDRGRTPLGLLALLTIAALPACAGAGGDARPTTAMTDAHDEEDRAAVGATLDALHEAAARADGARYFALFEPDAVFIGTDASERWSLAEFRAYAAPHFDAGRGWTYEPVERHVRLDAAGGVAWFDERLSNAKYGETRGSGVCTRGDDGRWRIAHYVLSFAVPNDAAGDVVDAIKRAR